jgi:D-glycero-alpha-D-manno-heptose 1-phosphate guanylyltransferase
MSYEMIILAGGLGTRLKEAVPDLPKCMAPINGVPFIKHVIDYFTSQGIERFIFSLGYKSEIIIDYLEKEFPGLSYKIALEQDPLGTGGAIKNACSFAEGKNVLITNGDTLFKVDIGFLENFQTLSGSYCTLCLKPMQNFDRYGVVEINDENCIESFKEKQFYKEGLINGGVYALNKNKFLKEELPEKFSFEKDYLEKLFTTHEMYGIVQDAYFIDIGIPEDYERAAKELA